MTTNAKLAIGAAALLLVWWYTSGQASAAPSSSSGASSGATCAAPSFPCSDKFPGMAGCCTKCSDDPKCSVTQTDGGQFANPGTDGPITNPSQVDVSGGPLVSPNQI